MINSNKEVEINAFKNMLNCKKYKNEETKTYIKYLKSIINGKDLSLFQREAPDFLLINNDKYIGIEHFLVDTLRLSNNCKVSITREVERNVLMLLDKYQNGKVFKKDKNKCVEASGDISEDVIKLLNSANNFDETSFISEFHRISIEHKGKVANYRSRIMKENNIMEDSKISICFLIEIPFLNSSKEWKVKDNNKIEFIQSIKGIPFTKSFVKELKKLSNIENIVLYFRDALNQKENDYIYLIEVNRFEEILSKEKIFKSFSSKYKGWNIKIKNVNKKDKDINMTFETV